MEIKKVLIAVDRETKSKSPVFDQGSSLAVKEGAKVMLLHVLPQGTTAELEDRVGTISDYSQAEGDSVRVKRQSTEINHAKAWLEGLCGASKECGIDTQYTVEVGKAGPAIVDVARRWNADLIVLGSTHRGTLVDAILDSVTNHVIHHAPCSVLFVH